MVKSNEIGKKCPIGIKGFDQISNGGLPRSSISLVLGGAGSGKTLFSLEFLQKGIEKFGENGIFVSFEEDEKKIVANCDSFNWKFPELLEGNKLAVYEAKIDHNFMVAGDFDIVGMLAVLDHMISKTGARRIVFDALDVMLDLLDNEQNRRREILRLNDWILRSDLTAILTLKVDENSSTDPSRYSWIQFITDTIILLRQQMAEYYSSRLLRILKYRGSSHVNNDCSMVISRNGLVVESIFQFEDLPPPSTERVSTGIERLDHMMSGGYLRGSGILITGSPGTAKTSISSSFANSMCSNGGRVIYFAFDETGAEIVRNMTSIGLDLQQHIDSGKLEFHNFHSRYLSPGETFTKMTEVIDDFKPAAVVVDPLSSVSNDPDVISLLGKRLMYFAKREQITTIWNSLPEVISGVDQDENSAAGASTAADTWIHLRYKVSSQERNRALTIVKSRGMSHSNQVREMILSDEGVDLMDVYAGRGQVLMGTDRLRQQEIDREAEQERIDRYETSIRRLQAEIATMKASYEIAEQELKSIRHNENSRQEFNERFQKETGKARWSDES